MNRIDVPLKQMSLTQKLDLMELLWADMTGNEKNLDSPAWHGEILNDREAALAAGKAAVSSWEEAKERIKNIIS